MHYNARKGLVWLLVSLLSLSLTSCLTYYERTQKFQQALMQGDYKVAQKQLNSGQYNKPKNRFLKQVNMGAMLTMDGKLTESNDWLEQAYIYNEDYQKQVVQMGLSLLTNAENMDYIAEDHEGLMIHYYKAINYLKLNNREAALVEAKRMDIKIKRHAEHKDAKFRSDAFIQTLMGLIYDLNGDWNNAFIAYRNAVEVYENEYSKLFGVGTPNQLKYDLLRTAMLTGFDDQVRRFEKQFGIRYNPENRPAGGEVLVFWHNGMGPVKTEWSLNFTSNGSGSGGFTFVDGANGFTIPFVNFDNSSPTDLTNLGILRIAVPKYEERKKIYSKGKVSLGSITTPLEQVEDLNGVAFAILKDRMAKELGIAISRVAVKKAGEIALRKAAEANAGDGKNSAALALGAGSLLLGITNAITEKADTRNWQTLPHSIYYARIPAAEGKYELKFDAEAIPPYNASSLTIPVEVKRGQTVIQTINSLDFVPISVKQ